MSDGEQGRPDVKAQRESFFEQLKDVRLNDIVVLDEGYATTKFTRLYGRSERGVRFVGRVPHGHWKLLTIIAAMTIEGVLAAASIDASTDGDVFGEFIRDVLVPETQMERMRKALRLSGVVSRDLTESDAQSREAAESENKGKAQKSA